MGGRIGDRLDGEYGDAGFNKMKDLAIEEEGEVEERGEDGSDSGLHAGC